MSTLYGFLMAYAILKHDLMDIRLVITKSVAIIITLLLIVSTMLIPQIIDLPLFLSASITVSIAIFWAFFGKSTIRAIQTPLEKKWVKDQYDADKALNKLTRDLSPVNTREDAFECVARLIQDTIEIKKIDAVIFLDNEENPLIRYRFTFNKDKEQVEVGEDSPKLSLISSDICPVERLHIEERKMVRSFGYDEHALLFPVRSSMAFEGYLLIGSKLSEDRYAPKDLQFFETIQNQMQIVLDRIRPYEQIKAEYERFQKHNELLARQQTASLMSMGIAHEIKNPLGMILSKISRLRENPADVELTLKTIDTIYRMVDRLNTVLNTMLHITPEKRELFDLAILCEEVAQAIQSTCNDKEINLKITVPNSVLDGDSTQLYQALINLTKNSIEAMPNGGTLSITAEPSMFRDKTQRLTSGVKLTVADTGTGIPLDIQPKIFDAYFSQGKYQSTGLGLSIVLQIIDKHGGMIDFVSVPGQGTSFSVYLPLPEL